MSNGMLIVIDGYNFIFTVPELERHTGRNHIEPVRDHIISLFSRYREKKRYDIIIVFDGTHIETGLPKKQSYSGVTVIYSKMGVDADTEIKRITSLCQNPQDVCIVTYDNDIKRYVKKCGCQVIDPKAMYKTILETLNLNKGRRPKSEEPECKRNGPSEDDAKHWKDVFKTPPNDETTSAVENKPAPSVKGKKSTPKTTDEPHYKYQGTPADEVQYWVRIFKEEDEDVTQD